MYCPASNGVGSPSKRTQKVDSESVMSSRRTSVALYCGASASMTRVSVTRSVMRGMLPGRSHGAECHPARCGLKPRGSGTIPVISTRDRGLSMPTTTDTFTGFRPEAIEFLVDLADNNDRSWFTPRKADYERLLKAPLEALCVALEGEFRNRGIPLHADPAKSPFRIYRDVRFSKDKSPYKTAASASFGWLGDEGGVALGACHAANVHASGGYFHLQPGNIYVGGGVWPPVPSCLKAFRDVASIQTADYRR